MKQGRTLSLVAITALALLSVIGVSSASASGFSASSYPSFPLSSGRGLESVTTTNGTVKCENQKLSGQLLTDNPKFMADVSDATCTFGKMEMNGCKIILRPGASGTGAGTFDIGPAGCGPITTQGPSKTISIGSQTGLPATFTNETAGGKPVVRVVTTAGNLKYTLSWSGKSETVTNGEIRADWTVKAFENAAQTSQAGLSAVEGGPGEGVYLAGETSEEAAKQPRFEAEAYPMSITGSQSQYLTYKTSAGNIKCTKAPLNGRMPAFPYLFVGPTSALALEGSYGGCVAFGQNASIAMNSCHYVLNVVNSGPGYSGDLGVSCSSPGDAIVVSAAGCGVRFPAQPAAVTYENLGAGSSRYVIANVAGEGLSYEVSGKSICGTVGLHTDGKLTGAVKIQA